MLRHWSLQALLLGSKRVNGQLQCYPSLARCYAQGQAIQSLDPSRLQPSDYVNLKGNMPKLFTPDSTFNLGYRQLSQRIPFPENSSGFLYLSSTVDKPQSAWEIRFRITDGNAPQSFKSGVDLLWPDQRPWHIPLRALGTKGYAALWELLLRDGLVDDALLHIRPYKVKQHIQTLDPSRLQCSDYLNISGTSHIKISAQESPFHIKYTTTKNSPVPFPDDARGFLYFHSPAAEPTAMWEIRFRVTDSSLPSSFKSGSDLLYPNETTWAISLGSLQAHNLQYLPLRDLLIREGFDVGALLRKIGFMKKKMATSSPFIEFSLDQRFQIDFQSATSVIFVSFNEQLRCKFRQIGPYLDPHSGSAWCRFEAYSSPGSTQPDQLAIRILEMITPVTVSKPELAHRVPMPQEGKLIMKYTKCGPKSGKSGPRPLTLDPRPWTLNAQMTAHPVIQSILRDAAT